MNDDELEKVPPFLPEEPVSKSKFKVAPREILGYVLLVFSTLILILTLVGGGRMIFDILLDGKGVVNSLNASLIAKVLALMLAYLLGLGAAVLSERVFGNFFMSLILKIFSWVLILLVAAVYAVIVYKLFNQHYNMLKYFLYMGILFSGLIAFVVLHLFMGATDMRLYAIPLIAVSVFQACEIVYRYVFTADAVAVLVFADLYFLIMMVALEALLLAHLGLLDKPRHAVRNLFLKIPGNFRQD
jgi:hypothetical protein